MKIGEQKEITAHGNTAIMKRISQDTYVLKRNGQVRFGTLDQIREDIAHFQETAALPASKAYLWA